jgi:hypothetical protein
MKHLALFALLALSLASGRSWALVGGTNLASDEPQTGILQIASYDGSQPGGSCTATVLYSSIWTARSWLVTAAHCFSKHDDLYYVYSHYRTPRASIRVRLRNSDGSFTPAWTSPVDSTVFVHPDWLAHGGQTSWFGPRDVAIIRVDWAIPMYDDDGVRIVTYQRPIYTGPTPLVSEPFAPVALDNFAQDVFCGQSSSSLRCDGLKNLWYSPSFRNTFVQIPYGAWTGGFYAPGDSGGPLLKRAPGFAREWNGRGSDLDVAKHGVVLGVLQGPTVFCDYIQNGNCNPGDGLAAHFQGLDNWLNSIGSLGQIARLSSWSFAGMFQVTTGTETQLSSSSTQSYTRPAYAARVVGAEIDPRNNQVYVWYENGFYSVGTNTDLDVFSQYPDPRLADVMPTRSYSGASGKLNRDIVEMIMGSTGVVYTYFRDGTYTMGVPDDLDAIRGAAPYSLPPGKTPDDIVAMANLQVPSPRVLVYYRDGTVSEGALNVLDYFGAPTPFRTGTARGASEIMAAGTRSNGSVVTWFEHPKLY